MKNIEPLYSIDISNYYLAAVADKCSDVMKLRVGLDLMKYFNSWVQLINLKAFRENNLEKTIFEKLKTIDYYTDQDVINDVCRKKILELPLKYNIVPRGEYNDRQKEYQEAIEEPVLVHFWTKPWQSPDTAFCEEWLKYKEVVL